MMFPSIFISHGSPMLTVMDNKSTNFLKSLANDFPKPKYIIIFSAHWMSKDLEILATDEPFLIYDFYNFPEELYNQEYEAQNELTKVDEIVKYLKNNGINITKNEDRAGYDHGVWSPLKLIYPEADIPVVQLSIPLLYDAKALVRLGEVLYPFRNEALIITSGAMTHNLRAMNPKENATPEQYAVEFNDWVVEVSKKGDKQSVINFLNTAPKLVENHPTLEHFLPFLIAFGASKNNRGKPLNNHYMYGNQSMESIIFSA